MPPNAPSNSRLPQLAVWSGYGTESRLNRNQPFTRLTLPAFIMQWHSGRNQSKNFLSLVFSKYLPLSQADTSDLIAGRTEGALSFSDMTVCAKRWIRVGGLQPRSQDALLPRAGRKEPWEREVGLHILPYPRNVGSVYVSGKLSAGPSRTPTLTLTFHLGQNVGLREG